MLGRPVLGGGWGRVVADGWGGAQEKGVERGRTPMRTGSTEGRLNGGSRRPDAGEGSMGDRRPSTTVQWTRIGLRNPKGIGVGQSRVWPGGMDP